jgi:hypothetical protein
MAVIAFLTLVLAAVAAEPELPTRIVERRDSPVSLVGLPCGDAAQKVSATIPNGERPEQLESPPFQCGKDCAVGVRVKTGQRIATLKIATSMVHDRGRVTAAISPALAPGALQSCHGESYSVAVMPRIDWPAITAIAYVAEVEFADGTSWRADANDVQAIAFQRWMLQPKKRQ